MAHLSNFSCSLVRCRQGAKLHRTMRNNVHLVTSDEVAGNLPVIISLCMKFEDFSVQRLSAGAIRSWRPIWRRNGVKNYLITKRHMSCKILPRQWEEEAQNEPTWRLVGRMRWRRKHNEYNSDFCYVLLESQVTRSGTATCQLAERWQRK